MFLIIDMSGIFPKPAMRKNAEDVGNLIRAMASSHEESVIDELAVANMAVGDTLFCKDGFVIRYVTDADAPRIAEEYSSAGIKQNLETAIAAHNRMIETIQNANVTCGLFAGMEIWHQIACEGAAITHTARLVGINAHVDMQAGIIQVEETGNG